MGEALARLTIVEWEGVADEAGQPVAVTTEGIGHLLDVLPVWLGVGGRPWRRAGDG